MSQAQKEIAVEMSAVETEAKLIQITLKVFVAQAMIGTVHRGFHVSDNGMEPMQQAGCRLVYLEMMDISFGQWFPVAGQGITLNHRPMLDILPGKGSNGFAAKIWHQLHLEKLWFAFCVL